MRTRSRWASEAIVFLVAGLAWLYEGSQGGVFGLAAATLPGALLVGSGVAGLALPGDPRIRHVASLAGLLGVLFAFPALFATGLEALLLAALSAAAFVAAGSLALREEPPVAGVPTALPSPLLAAQVAADGVFLGVETFAMTLPPPDAHARLQGELEAMRGWLGQHGWLEKPADYHQTPPPLDSPRIALARSVRVDFEALSFESGYEPRAGEPGRERWLGYTPTRNASAWVLRHRGAPRPWLVCIHGYRMGFPWMDLPAFRAQQLHEELGVNVVLPTLPLHGARRVRRMSGEGFFGSDFVDSIHAEAQAMWDIRRILGWLRAQGATQIGVYGLSLGGYNAALLAGLEADLACVVAGIPATDFVRLVWRHAPRADIEAAERAGIAPDAAREVLRVVSPLVLAPKPASERLSIFAGMHDLLVPADQPRDLWEHWNQPRITWYEGSHMTFVAHAQVREHLTQVFRSLRTPA